MKSIRFEIKEIAADGSFEGILSPYGNVDGGNDVVDAGAYTKTLKEHGDKVPMLWQHKTDVPIGELLLEDREDGLWCKGQLLMADPLAQRAYLYIKAKIVKGLSIGFDSIKENFKKGVRHLTEIRLWEGSVVTFPMNEMALIMSVKARTGEKGDFNEELTETQLTDAGYQMRCALSNALASLFWNGLSKEEMLTLAETIIQQFADVYMAYLPAYVDMLAEHYGAVETWSSKRDLERKSGAEFSSTNVTKIKSICDALLGAHTELSALVETKAADGTLLSKAAEPIETEPVDDHSAALIDEIMATL